jgi:hypothetical protein
LLVFSRQPKIKEKQMRETQFPFFVIFIYFFFFRSHGAWSRRCFVAHRKLPRLCSCAGNLWLFPFR